MYVHYFDKNRNLKPKHIKNITDGITAGRVLDKELTTAYLHCELG